MGDSNLPVALHGEVFLAGPDEARTRVSCGESLAVEFCRLLDEGVPGDDAKQQGAAFITVVYPHGRKVQMEVTREGLVRHDRKVIQVNRQQMINLLERMVEECAKPAS